MSETKVKEICDRGLKLFVFLGCSLQLRWALQDSVDPEVIPKAKERPTPCFWSPSTSCCYAVLFIFQSVRCLDRLREQVTLFSSSSTSSQVVCFSLLALRFFVARSGSGSSILFRSSRLRKGVGVVRPWFVSSKAKTVLFPLSIDQCIAQEVCTAAFYFSLMR